MIDITKNINILISNTNKINVTWKTNIETQ